MNGRCTMIAIAGLPGVSLASVSEASDRSDQLRNAAGDDSGSGASRIERTYLGVSMKLWGAIEPQIARLLLRMASSEHELWGAGGARHKPSGCAIIAAVANCSKLLIEKAARDAQHSWPISRDGDTATFRVILSA
jgi:hypothetical protein